MKKYMITIQRFYSNKKFNSTWILFLLCGVNLLFMHFYILAYSHLESKIDLTSIFDNLFGVYFDVSLLTFFFYYLTNKKTIITSFICFFITWIWSLSNIIYSRFFHHYLTISAISQGDALNNSVIINSIIDNIYWGDLYFLIIIPLFWIIIKKKISNERFQVKKILLFACFILFSDLCVHFIFCSFSSQTRSLAYYQYRIHTLHINTHRYSLQPNFVHFNRGSLRTLALEISSSIQGCISLSGEQRSEIERVIKSSRIDSFTHNVVTPSNIIFILVESYMSFVSDIKINGNEVTPFLNSLQRDSSIYFNGHMQENVTIGESSDGQFIYVTGLLPLRSTITISRAKDITLPGLPKLLGRESRMIIPTIASMWRQDEMCRQYGFDELYTSNDFEGDYCENLSDKQIFQLAKQKDTTNKTSFFSFIVTMSMHQPYTKQIDSTFIIPTSQSISKELACYLNACHYTDQQIENYFNYLKEQNIYENSLIIIAADHAVHCTDFGGVNKDLPFYIINAKGLPQNMIRDKKCNQVDLYSTLIDILGIKSNWHGLGCSLLSSKYEDNIPASKWDISELIILGNYFNAPTENSRSIVKTASNHKHKVLP